MPIPFRNRGRRRRRPYEWLATWASARRGRPRAPHSLALRGAGPTHASAARAIDPCPPFGYKRGGGSDRLALQIARPRARRIPRGEEVHLMTIRSMATAALAVALALAGGASGLSAQVSSAAPATQPGTFPSR